MELWTYLISIYSDHDNDNSMASHFEAFEKLKTLESAKSSTKIKIEYVHEAHYTGWAVDGIEAGVTYALDFTPWNEWLGMELEAETLNILQPHEIAAHCLWEMSFYSFDEEKTQAALSDLSKRAEQLENRQEDNTAGD